MLTIRKIYKFCNHLLGYNNKDYDMKDEKTVLFQGEKFNTFAERGVQPVLEVFCEALKNFAMQPIATLECKSVKPFWDGLDTPFLKGCIRPYTMEKCEKVSICNCILMNRILTAALIIFPHDDYDFPVLVLEWNETEKDISLVIDLVPTVDLVMYDDYRTKYIDGLETYWMKYKSLSGMEPNRFAWVRMMFSPYYLSGALPKDKEQNIDDALEIIKSYLEYWLTQWETAVPIVDEKMKAYIKQRKQKMREHFRSGDEGAKTLAQMIGQETMDLLLTCNF
jgi:hypothetical protein